MKDQHQHIMAIDLVRDCLSLYDSPISEIAFLTFIEIRHTAKNPSSVDQYVALRNSSGLITLLK